LNRLPAKYRAPLVLCYLNGQTHDQAAAELGCPVGTVRSRLSRGRDLLRRRLTRRGYAPNAAMLGRGWDLPAQVGIEAVPQGLILPTVDAALAIDVFKTIPAGAAAASVLALTQGVLTTMKLAQLKGIGLTILATILAAGSVIAVGYAAGQSATQARYVEEVLANAGAEEEKATPPATNLTSPSQNAPADATDPFQSNAALPRSDDPFQSNAALPRSDADSSRVVEPSNRSIRELEVDLKLALNDDDRAEKLSRSNSISDEERNRYRGKVLLIQAKLDGLAEDLADEIDRLKLELIKNDARFQQASAQVMVSGNLVARNHRLNERKAGSVSDDGVATAEAQYRISDGQRAIVRAEKAEVELRIQQLQKRVGRIKDVLKKAEPPRELKP
jgi:Sigma-70, region 4